ncbi:helix-turn-helix transcriptional regulator [Georgenia thermotolerans]|uniref:Helix-turn-helix domain-containing protein n=1 Tax=Georgenia thermotolerans TaxID=527326 RepID=A0A7J5UM22_9MICO|nr:helix-turn-helix domain-containing protein [Georgenia thermotolerans]KAE8763425.1 helix-turn-helix domain-containing protein [Georgenia thermotolerans]
MSEKKEPPLDRTPMWTLDELCAKLHTTPATVHTWRKRGTAPKAYRIGRHLLFEEADVRAWLETRAATPDHKSRSGTDSGW